MSEEMVKKNVVEDVIDDIEDGLYRVTLKKPYIFEGKSYSAIDLIGLEDIKAADMIEVTRLLYRKGNVDFLQEMTLEYALNLAAKATGKPIEFFEMLPPYAAMQIKNRVTGFLYRQE